MKTTVELPDELMREIKIRAIKEDRKLKDMIADLLRRGLAADESPHRGEIRHRVKLPLIRSVTGWTASSTPSRWPAASRW